MSPRLTTKEFIDRARAVHGDKYGYAFSVYISSREKIQIYCPEHGIFWQKASGHLSSNGCVECGKNKLSNYFKSNNDTFIEKAREVHGNNYDYDLVNYEHVHKKVTIICNKHGTFNQTPGSHLGGSGCPECGEVTRFKARRSDTNSFIEKAKQIHCDKYNYTHVDYINDRTKIIVICFVHGSFKILPGVHLRGRGCPGCSEYGFNRTRPASLYVLRSDCGRYMKIGITHNPKQRHNKLKRDTPFSFKRIELIEGPGDQIANLEKELLAEYQPAEFTETFDGYTEWRLWSDSIRHKLISFMNKESTHGLV